VFISYLEANCGGRRSEKYVVKGSKYAHWIGLYLSFHSNWVLGPFVHGRLQDLQTSEVFFAHVITPLKQKPCFQIQCTRYKFINQNTKSEMVRSNIGHPACFGHTRKYKTYMERAGCDCEHYDVKCWVWPWRFKLGIWYKLKADKPKCKLQDDLSESQPIIMIISWIGLYLNFHLNWVLGPFVHGRLQNLQTSEVTFAHVITPWSVDNA